MSIFLEYKKQWNSFSNNLKAFLIFDTCNQFSVAVFTLYFPRYLIELGFKEDLYGSLFGIASLMMAITSILAGLISDRIGRGKSILLGIGASKLTFITRGFLIFTPFLYGSYAIHGAFITLYTASLIPYIYESTSADNRVHAFSTRGVMIRAANIMGNLLGGVLPLGIRLLFSDISPINVYRMIFLISLVTAILGFWYFARIESANPSNKSVKENTRSLIDNIKSLSSKNVKFIIKFGLVSATLAFGAGMFLPFVNTYFLREFNMGPEVTGLVFSLSNFAIIVGITFSPHISKRLGIKKAIVITRVLSFPLFLVMGFSRYFWMVATAYLLRVALQQMSNPLQNTFIMSGLDSNTRATANGIFNAATEGARAVAVFIAGYVIVSIGYSSLFVVALAFYIISTSLFYVFFVHKEAKNTLPG